MDKRKISGLSHDGRVSQAYLHERFILQKRLDQFQREQDKTIKKISKRRETLANAFTAETSKNRSIETSLMEINSLRRSRAGSNANLYPGSLENMEINPRPRKISVPSDLRYRKLSFPSGETKSTKRPIRQISDPLQSSSQTSEDSNVTVTLPRRKFTTGQLDLAVPSMDCRPQSGGSESHIFKSSFLRNQSKIRANFLSARLPSELANRHYTPLSNSKSEPDYSQEKMNFQTRLPSSSANTTTRMVNETSTEVKNKYIKDSSINVPKKVLDNQRKTSHGSNSSFQELPYVSNDNIEPYESEVDKIIQSISPGALITNGQFQNTEIGASDVYLCRESPTARVQIPDYSQKDSHFNFNSGSDDETVSDSLKRVSRKASLSENKSTRHLHALTSSTQEAGATGGVGHLSNAWTEHNRTARRKISTVVAPQGIEINAGNSSGSSNEKTDEGQNSTIATRQNVDALRGFRRLALVAVAAERFRARVPKPASENRQIALPERKLSTKERLEELQRPTESYLRHYVVDETVSKTPNLKTSSKSLSEMINSDKTSASGVTNIRRISQAAMATRILIDRKHRNTPVSGFSGLESQRQTNQGKTLAEMMNELKDCRYLRNSTTDDE